MASALVVEQSSNGNFKRRSQQDRELPSYGLEEDPNSSSTSFLVCGVTPKGSM